MTERLTVDQVIEINTEECLLSGENPAVLDRGGLEAAVERPWSGFGEHEAFPSLYDKAASLLHGIAARQVFENGNKRTAWVAALTLLEGNGIDLGRVEPIQAEALVRAAAVDHTFGVEGVAEWLEVTQRERRVGYATDPRVEYLALALGAAPSEAADGLLDAAGMHFHSLAVSQLPVLGALAIVMRIHWRPADLGRRHLLEINLEQPDGHEVAAVYGDDWSHYLQAPAPSAHEHHNGVMPTISMHGIEIVAVAEGSARLRVSLDGLSVGALPFRVHQVSSNVPDVIPFG